MGAVECKPECCSCRTSLSNKLPTTVNIVDVSDGQAKTRSTSPYKDGILPKVKRPEKKNRKSVDGSPIIKAHHDAKMEEKRKLAGVEGETEKSEDKRNSDSDSNDGEIGKKKTDEEGEETSVEKQVWHLVDEFINVGDVDGAILIACHGGQVAALERCIKKDAVVTVVDHHGFAAGYFATLSGSVEVLRMVLAKDVHEEYEASWFDTRLTDDDMTPLMIALRHGLKDIYRYLLFEKGCRLRLLGNRYGVDLEEHPGGLLAPLDKWLIFLSEVTQRCMVSKTRPVTIMRNDVRRTVSFGKDPNHFTEEEFEQARKDRLEARNFVREVVKADQERSRKVEEARQARASERATGISVQLANPVPDKMEDRAHGHRHALSADTSKLLAQAQALESGCAKLNLVKKQEEHGHRCLEGRNDEESEEGETWGNDGSEFVDEPHVAKYMPLFKGNILALLGPHRLRELLRVVQVKTYEQKDIIFEEREKVENLVILQKGEVHLESKEQSMKDKITVDEGNAAQVLDNSAYMATTINGLPTTASGMHTATATVVSSKCSTFIFQRKDIVENCGFDSLNSMIANALSMAMVSAVNEFKRTLTSFEMESLASTMEYREHTGNDVLAVKGQKLHQVTLVQRGQLRVQEGKHVKRYIISKTKARGRAGAIWQKAYVCGLRSVLFDTNYPMNVEVEDGVVQSWILSLERVEKSMPGGMNLRRLLQVCTYTEQLRNVVLFKKLKESDTRLRRLVEQLHPQDSWEGEDIVTQGARDTALYVLVEGIVSILVNGKEEASLHADLDHHRVHMFGEFAMLENTARGATVRVTSASAVCLEITEDHIREMFGSLPELFKEQGTTVDAIVDEERKKKHMTSGADWDNEHVVIPDNVTRSEAALAKQLKKSTQAVTDAEVKKAGTAKAKSKK